MASDHDTPTFDSASADASLTYPAQASSLKKGGHVVLKGQACKVIDVSTSKPGKHGHAKVRITATSLFTSQKIEELFPAHERVNIPNISKDEYILMHKATDGFLHMLVPSTGEEKSDVSIEGAKAEVREKLEKLKGAGKDVRVVILTAMGNEMVIDVVED